MTARRCASNRDGARWKIGHRAAEHSRRWWLRESGADFGLHRTWLSRLRWTRLMLLSACVGCGAAPTPSPAPSLPATFDLAAIDAYLTGQVARRGFVGLSVAIVEDGVIVLDKPYGHSQLSPDVAVQPDTAFAIASITKQFVAALALQLVEEKKLSLDAAVAAYFPDLTRAADITIYDLMTHVSGYRDNYPLDFVDEEMKQPITPDEIIARYAKQPLDFEPRTRFSYSSTGYKILGRIIEKITGSPLAVVLDERVLRPLGMLHSSYMPTEGSPGLARGYTSFALGPAEPAAPEAHDWAFGGGGLYASAGDIAKWDVALMSGRVLGAAAFERFSAPRRLADGRTTGYGCGIQTNVNRSGELVLRHSGRDAGFASSSVLLPRTQSAVVILSNRDDSEPDDLVEDIVALLNKAHRPLPLKIAGAPLREVARDMFTALQAGRIDRSLLGRDFSLFLTDAKLQSASARLRPLGTALSIEIEDTHERAGMEAATVRFTFATLTLEASMFRSIDGKVQQFLLSKR